MTVEIRRHRIYVSIFLTYFNYGSKLRVSNGDEEEQKRIYETKKKKITSLLTQIQKSSENINQHHLSFLSLPFFFLVLFKFEITF